MTRKAKIGVVLINIGTPAGPDVPSVRRYLREFLMDGRVITIPYWLRWLLVRCIIVPLRSPKSANAYAKIWTTSGSPLLRYGQSLAAAVQSKMGPDFDVRLGMRYAEPSLERVVVEMLQQNDVEELVLFPLYPQYSSSATGSCIQRVMEVLGSRAVIPKLRVVGDFYDHDGFIRAQSALIKRRLERFRADHLLLSYHGLPESHVKATTNQYCLSSPNCCAEMTSKNRFCYRAQCFQTSRRIAETIGLRNDFITVGFQSRLGREPWIAPYTDLLLEDLYKKGVRRLAVAVPSFVADCLETLEEIGMRAKDEWIKLGGEDLTLIECVNDNEDWVDAVCRMAREP